MEITLFYQKERKEFGRPVNAFAPSEVTVLEEFEHEDELVRNHVERNPTILDIQAKPDMSQQDVCASPRSRSPRALPMDFAQHSGCCRRRLSADPSLARAAGEHRELQVHSARNVPHGGWLAQGH